MLKSNYALYKEEREGAVIVEDEYGFATAKQLDDYFYIDEIFVKKEYRKTNKATDYADELSEIARAAGYTKLLGSVDPTAHGATTSLKVLLGYGMTLHSVDNGLIYFIKEL